MGIPNGARRAISCGPSTHLEAALQVEQALQLQRPVDALQQLLAEHRDGKFGKRLRTNQRTVSVPMSPLSIEPSDRRMGSIRNALEKGHEHMSCSLRLYWIDPTTRHETPLLGLAAAVGCHSRLGGCGRCVPRWRRRLRSARPGVARPSHRTCRSLAPATRVD